MRATEYFNKLKEKLIELAKKYNAKFIEKDYEQMYFPEYKGFRFWFSIEKDKKKFGNGEIGTFVHNNIIANDSFTYYDILKEEIGSILK